VNNVDTNRNPWEQLPGETNAWFNRFDRFRLLTDRSVQAAFNQWRLAKGRKLSRSTPKSWRDASKRWNWYERGEAWDRHCLEQASMEIEKERIRILQSGYALKHERIKVLNELAEMLLGEIKEVDKRWCPDVKSIGQGENAERVDIVRFNGSLIEQARKSLEDIAAELGERINRQELTLPGAKVKGYTVLAHPDLWDEDENAKPD
jgi:hypothetical protein